MSELSAKQRATLKQFLVDRFSYEELIDITFDLGISRDSFPSNTHRQLAREIVSYCERINRLGCLVAKIVQERPESSISELLAVLPPCEPYTKIQIIIPETVPVNTALLKLAISQACVGVSPLNVEIIGGTKTDAGTAILASLPAEAAEQLASRYRAIGEGDFGIVAKFNGLSPSAQEAWKQEFNGESPLNDELLGLPSSFSESDEPLVDVIRLIKQAKQLIDGYGDQRIALIFKMAELQSKIKIKENNDELDGELKYYSRDISDDIESFLKSMKPKLRWQQNESIVYRKHWFVLVKNMVPYLLLVLLSSGLLYILSVVLRSYGLFLPYPIVEIVVGVVFLIRCVFQYEKWRKEIFIISPRALIHYRGSAFDLFGSMRVQMFRSNIEDVIVEQNSKIDLFLGTGDLVVRTGNIGSSEHRFSMIWQPRLCVTEFAITQREFIVKSLNPSVTDLYRELEESLESYKWRIKWQIKE